MADLSDVRRRFPPEDPEAYGEAYAEAELAERLGELVHQMRTVEDLAPSELAARMGVEEDDILRAEEGDASLTVAFLDRLARATGARMTISTVAAEMVLGFGAPSTTPVARDD